MQRGYPLQPITKTQFKVGLDCIHKLRHHRDRLPQATEENDMLRLLAEGGAAVEALQRAIEPGHFNGGSSRDTAAAESMAAIREAAAKVRRDGNRRSLYEVTVELDGFLARIDLLRIHADRLELVEIKAKTVPADGFLKQNGTIYSDWLPYIQDIGFQYELLKRWVAHHGGSIGLNGNFSITPRLLLVDSSGRAAGLDVLSRTNYSSCYRRGTRGIRASVEHVSSPAPSKTELLRDIDVMAAVEVVLQDAGSKVATFKNRGIADCMEAMKAIVTTAKWPDPAHARAVGCKSCEFRVEPPKASGFAKCWDGIQTIPSDHVLSLVRVNDKQLETAMQAAGANARIADVPESLLTASQRNHYAVTCSGRPFVTGRFASDPMGALLPSGAQLPVHFVDFECSGYPIPSRIGGTPYEHVPFQFEGHLLPSPDSPLSERRRLDGFLELVNPDPRRAFVDAMSVQFAGEGPIYHWHNYEKTVLEAIRRTLDAERNAGTGDPRDPARISFIDSLVGVDGGRAGRLVDLLPLAKESFCHPAQRGSYSIKRVVPIAWAEQSIRAAFMPNHDAAGDPDCYDAAEDPYDGLPAPPTPILEAVGGIETLKQIVSNDDGSAGTDGGGVRSGGMAMLAYHYVRMFGGAEDPAIVDQFRRYCRLDSAAMVMVYALMRDVVPAWPRA